MPSQRYTPGYVPNQIPRGLVAAAAVNPFEKAIGDFEGFANKLVSEQAGRTAQERVFGGEQPGLTPGFTDAQRVYNRAAEVAYQAQTEGQIRQKVAELGAKYTGLQPTDPQQFAEEYDAFSGAIAGSVPDSMRAAVGFELQQRKALAVAGITEQANRHELRRNDSAISAGIQSDIDEASRLARDGADPEALALLYQRADGRVNERVQLGLMAPAEAEIQKTEFRSKIQAQAIFGQALRGGNLPSMVGELMKGRGLAEGLTVKDRDALVSDITHEINRRHGAMVRAESEDRLLMKDTRDTITTSLWANVYSGDPAKRPTTEQIVAATTAKLIGPEDAQQMIRTLATDKAARNDTAVVGALESEMAMGVDIGTRIGVEQAKGLLSPEVAADLREKNTANLRRDLPEPVTEFRRQIDGLFTVSGPGADLYAEQEQARKASALQFYDDTVRAAPPGVDPQTGLSFRELEARKAFNILEEKQRERASKKLRKIKPRGAVLQEKTGQPALLDVGKTAAAIQQDFKVGAIGRDEMLAEFRLIEQWEQAGLTVK